MSENHVSRREALQTIGHGVLGGVLPLPAMANGDSGGGSVDRTRAGSPSRAMRWELNLKTENGQDYLGQLAAMKAILVLPDPPDWKSNQTYKDLSNPIGQAFERDELPSLLFVDDDPASARKLAEALGLKFSPPLFVAFFPKDVEEGLAAKERAYRGREETEIFATKFKVLVRDGKPVIAVTDQLSARR